DELLLLERSEQAMDGCFRDPQPIRDLGNAESRGTPQDPEDARRPIDGLDRAATIPRGEERGHGRRRRARSSAPKMIAVDVAPGSWCPMLREPRYDARPFRACNGRVASTPALAAAAAFRAASSVSPPASNVRWNA